MRGGGVSAPHSPNHVDRLDRQPGPRWRGAHHLPRLAAPDRSDTAQLSAFCRFRRFLLPSSSEIESHRGTRSMKLTIPRAELQRGLARIQAIVEKRNSMPILANALLRATKGSTSLLEIAATDL